MRRRVHSASRQIKARGKPESSLGQVIQLAETLSPADRLNLWSHLAGLPDSGIESTNDVRSLIRDLWMQLPHDAKSKPAKTLEWKQNGVQAGLGPPQAHARHQTRRSKGKRAVNHAERASSSKERKPPAAL